MVATPYRARKVVRGVLVIISRSNSFGVLAKDRTGRAGASASVVVRGSSVSVVDGWRVVVSHLGRGLLRLRGRHLHLTGVLRKECLAVDGPVGGLVVRASRVVLLGGGLRHQVRAGPVFARLQSLVRLVEDRGLVEQELGVDPGLDAARIL